MDEWRHVKGIENPAYICRRRMSSECLQESGWLNGPAWLQTDEEKWPRPCCQVNEVEAEQATITVATETELDQLIDCRQYSSFKRIRNFIAYSMRFKTKQKGLLKSDEIHQAEQILFRPFHPKASECFQVDSKQQRNLKKIEHCQVVTLHRGRWNNPSVWSTQTFESRLQCKTSNFVDSKTPNRISSVGEST